MKRGFTELEYKISLNMNVVLILQEYTGNKRFRHNPEHSVTGDFLTKKSIYVFGRVRGSFTVQPMEEIRHIRTPRRVICRLVLDSKYTGRYDFP